jgi:hypothetical protein
VSEIIDLDDLVPQDKTVTFAGRRLTVPGDMPMEVFLKVQKVAQMAEAEEPPDDAEVQASSLMRDSLRQVLCWNVKGEGSGQIREEIDAQLDLLGPRAFMQMLTRIYQIEEPEAPEEQADRPTESAGTTSTNPPTTSEEGSSDS